TMTANAPETTRLQASCTSRPAATAAVASTAKRHRRRRDGTSLRLAGTLAALALAVGLSAPQAVFATAACLPDTSGADDINANQKDLNEFCQSAGNDGGPSGCLSSDAFLTWTWDDTGWTGSNTGDGCALYDTDVPADGRANFALCESVGGSPASPIVGSP